MSVSDAYCVSRILTLFSSVKKNRPNRRENRSFVRLIVGFAKDFYCHLISKFVRHVLSFRLSCLISSDTCKFDFDKKKASDCFERANCFDLKQ